MKVKIVGRALIICLAVAMATLRRLMSFEPDSLILRDAKGEPIFRLSVGNIASINPNGAVFNDTDREGKAMLTVMIPEAVTSKENWVEEVIFQPLAKLKELELQVLAAENQLTSRIADVTQLIEFE